MESVLQRVKRILSDKWRPHRYNRTDKWPIPPEVIVEAIEALAEEIDEINDQKDNG